ncbi:MAG: GNAT family N-acetyltransferase, partial [Bacteroidota bacterium]
QPETSSKWSKLNVFRLRAMAVDMDFRRFKIGLKLIEMGREEVVHAGGEGIWCDARVSALQFYRAAGFSELEEEYFITNIGWHRFMFLTCN